MQLSINHIAAGLAKAQQLNTAQTLGDRSQYIGASDLGQCPRKVILSKITPKEPDLATLIRFARGHLAEAIIAEALQDDNPHPQIALTTDIPYCSQCRWWAPHSPRDAAQCPACQSPLKLLPLEAHLDFVLPGNTVLEVKSSNTTEIRDSWKMQLQTQMLLYEHRLHQSPQGYILVMDIARGELALSGPYVADPVMAPDIVNRAIDVWEGMLEAERDTAPESVDIKTEPSPLCSFCGYLASCPAFQGGELPSDLIDFFEKYMEACKAEKDAKAKKSAMRDQVLSLLVPGRYKAGAVRVSLFERSRTSVDLEALSALLDELGQDINAYQKKSSYKVLDVKAA